MLCFSAHKVRGLLNYREQSYASIIIWIARVTLLMKGLNLTNTPTVGKFSCVKILLKSWVVKVTSWSENDLKTIVGMSSWPGALLVFKPFSILLNSSVVTCLSKSPSFS